MKIVSLAENTSIGEGIGAEHGLSIYIETGEHKILFDAGQTDLFAKNAELLGVELSEVDIAVLSHGHYDHGGGLLRFLEINDRAQIYMSRYAFDECYNGEGKYIGLDLSLKESDRVVYTEEPLELACGITLFSSRGFEKTVDLGSFGLTAVRDGERISDDFRHEQYLLVEEDGHRILFSGCSHNGILNIVRWFPSDVVVGGFHFSKLPIGDALEGYAKQLCGYDTIFYTCHCTGKEQYEFMKRHMDRLEYLSAGSVLEL